MDGKQRRLLIRAGIAVAAILFGSLINWWLASSRLDRSGRDYAEDAVSHIADAWSDDEVLKRASPQFRDSVDPQELKAGFSVLAHRVGLLKTCAAAQGEAHEVQGRPVTATYVLPCQFDKAAVKIHITLIRMGSDWRILGFNIESPSLTPGGDPGSGLKPYPQTQT